MSSTPTPEYPSLAGFGETLTKIGLQTLFEPPSEESPSRLLIGLGKDYRQRDLILSGFDQKELYKRTETDPTDPAPFVWLWAADWELSDSQTTELSEIICVLNRLLPAGQFVISPQGQFFYRYHWLVNPTDWTVLPLVEWLDMSAFFLQQFLELLEKVVEGQITGKMALRELETKLGAALHEA
ncbi:MAG: hypothetical protein AB7I41_12880 [Candidatus Sericytochromatia bacterium]